MYDSSFNSSIINAAIINVSCLDIVNVVQIDVVDLIHDGLKEVLEEFILTTVCQTFFWAVITWYFLTLDL